MIGSLTSIGSLATKNLNNAPKKLTGAIQTSGRNWLAVLGSDVSYNIPNDFTYEAWCFIGINQAQVFFSIGNLFADQNKGSIVSDAFNLSYNNSSNSRWEYNQTTKNGVGQSFGNDISNLNGTVGVWQHIAVTRTAGVPNDSIQIFINGSLKHTGYILSTNRVTTFYGLACSRDIAPMSSTDTFTYSTSTGSRMTALRMSNINRYNGNNFTPSTNEYTYDTNTLFAFNFTYGSDYLKSADGKLTLTVRSDTNSSVTNVTTVPA